MRAHLALAFVATALGACLAAPMPPEPEDGGPVALDGGTSEDGGPAAPRDGGAAARDGGSTLPAADGGAPPADGGPDAGALRDGGARDGGVPPPDGGVPPPPDAGAPPPDAGAPPPDAGAPPPDAGAPPAECTYRERPESEYTCFGPEVPATYQSRVFAAFDTIYREHPEYFDFTDNPYGCCPRVVDADGYVQGVAAILNRSPDVCAWQDPYAGDELAIKDKGGTFSEGYDILTAAGYVRKGPGTYRGVCRPAWF
jgi:hypothetical protein